MSQSKIMDFCGSGDLMRAILTDHHTHDALVKGNANKKFCVLIFAEDDKTTLQGNDLSVQIEYDLRFGESMESLDGRHEPEYQPKFGPNVDGWLEWRGGMCPVDPKTVVTVCYRDGLKTDDREAWTWDWKHYSEVNDIVAYKIVHIPHEDEEAQV